MNQVRIYGNNSYQKQVNISFNSIYLEDFFILEDKVRLYKEFEDSGTKISLRATFDYNDVKELFHQTFEFNNFLFKKKGYEPGFVAKIGLDMIGNNASVTFKDSRFNVIVNVINFQPTKRKGSKAKRKARENARVFTREGRFPTIEHHVTSAKENKEYLRLMKYRIEHPYSGGSCTPS